MYQLFATLVTDQCGPADLDVLRDGTDELENGAGRAGDFDCTLYFFFRGSRVYDIMHLYHHKHSRT